MGWKFSVQGSNLAPFFGSGTKIKIPCAIKTRLAPLKNKITNFALFIHIFQFVLKYRLKEILPQLWITKVHTNFNITLNELNPFFEIVDFI